jgi:hypothetical protein
MQTRMSTILEIVSAIAVVISLVFVGLEIRNSSKQTEQNTQALQVAAYQDLIGRIVEINTIGIQQSTTIETLIALESPTEQQVEQLNGFLWIIFRHGDMAYFQFENGAINEERMLSAMTPLLARLKYTYVSERWDNVKEMSFVPSYRRYVDSQIKLMASSTGD